MISGIVMAEDIVKLVVELVKIYEAKGPINEAQLIADIQTIVGVIKQYFPKGVAAPAAVANAVTPAVEGKPQ